MKSVIIIAWLLTCGVDGDIRYAEADPGFCVEMTLGQGLCVNWPLGDVNCPPEF